MKSLIFILLLISWSVGTVGQGLIKDQQKAVSTFISRIKHQEIEKLSDHVSFPLERRYPLPSVKNKADFIKRYNEIFDRKLVEMIVGSKVNSDWSDVGWRGIMLLDGDLWLE